MLDSSAFFLTGLFPFFPVIGVCDGVGAGTGGRGVNGTRAGIVAEVEAAVAPLGKGVYTFTAKYALGLARARFLKAS